jgi:hypothetical protein
MSFLKVRNYLDVIAAFANELVDFGKYWLHFWLHDAYYKKYQCQKVMPTKYLDN